MKYLEFPDLGDGETFAVCADCFKPNMEFVLTMGGVTPADTFDEMVVQMDDLQASTGAEDPHRPNITEGVEGLVCYKCGRVSEAVA